MAVQYRKDKNRWRVYWRNPFSKRIESKSFDTELEARKYDSLVKHRLKFEQESFFNEVGVSKNETSTDITLEQLHFLYLKAKKFDDASLSWQTTNMRRIHAMIGNMPIANITRDTLESVKRRELADIELKPVTVRGHLAVLRTILRWAVEQGYLESMPTFPKLPPARYEHFIPPTQDEIERLLAVSPPHLQREIILGSQLGIRVGPSELFKLKWSDFDFAAAVLRLSSANKNPDEPIREIPLRQDILELLEQWHDEDSAAGIDYVIHFKGKPVTVTRHAWNLAMQRAGIKRRIRPYDLRHSFGSELVAAGVDIGTVAKLMGHSSPLMFLKHYQHVADKQKRDAVEALPNVPFVCPAQYAPKKEALEQ